MQRASFSRILEMMEELTIDGKKYISARHASRLTGYAKDYIGQLCRSEALDARKVGRNWYIEESSLKEHRKTYQGAPVVALEEMTIEPHKESRPLREVADEYLSKAEKERKEARLGEVFSVTYRKDEGPLIPALEARNTNESSSTKKTTIQEVHGARPLVGSVVEVRIPKKEEEQVGITRTKNTEVSREPSLKKGPQYKVAEYSGQTVPEKPKPIHSRSALVDVLDKLLPASVLCVGLFLITSLLVESSLAYGKSGEELTLVREELLIGGALLPFGVGIPLQTGINDIE